MRTVVNRPRFAFAALAFAGMGGAFWEWLDHGQEATSEPGFVVALAAAGVGVICWTIVTVVPLAFAAFAAGARHAGAAGAASGSTTPAAPRHLTSV